MEAYDIALDEYLDSAECDRLEWQLTELLGAALESPVKEILYNAASSAFRAGWNGGYNEGRRTGREEAPNSSP